MKDYELTVVFHPDLEMNLDPALDKVKKTIESSGGTITKEENDGKKRLAYPIGGQSHALYYYYEVSLPSDAPNKISTTLNITDEVLRYLLVRVDERKAKLAARQAATEAKRGAGSDAESTEPATDDSVDNAEEDN